jgi:hypothetical protein
MVRTMKALSIVKGAFVVIVAAAMLHAVPATSTTRPAGAHSPDRPSPSMMVRLTQADGSSRTVALEGVGCSESICSRVVVISRAEGDAGAISTPLDTVAVITNIRDDKAQFVFRDGTMKRLSVVPWNRVFYVHGGAGSETIDLAQLSLVEFLPEAPLFIGRQDRLGI